MKRLNLKHLSLITAASLTFALLVYSRTPNPDTALSPQTTRDAKLQQAQKDIQKGGLSRLVASSNDVLKKYPTAEQLKKIENPKLREHLERGRKLIEAGKAASGWNAAQLVEYEQQVEQNSKTIGQIISASLNNLVNKLKKDCLTGCSNAGRTCGNNCDQTPYPTICKIQCEQSYWSCQANCQY